MPAYGTAGCESRRPVTTLGVDYNIFLATRAREEAARVGTRRGIVDALAVTGGVITSAGFFLSEAARDSHR